jgi:hypothetical protein
MRIDTRRTGALLAGLAMAAGIAYFLISDSDANQAPGGRLPGDSSKSLTPTESPSPTTEPPPELNNTGSDFEAIWRSINTYRSWLYEMNPQRRLLGQIYAPSCSCFKDEARILSYLDKRDLRIRNASVEIQSIELLDRPRDDIARIEVVNRQLPQQIIDSDGRVVEHSDGWGPTRWNFVLGRTNGQWLVRSAIKLGPADGNADA